MATLHTNKILKNATLTVYNLYGQQVKQIKSFSGQVFVFDRGDLSIGLYFLRLTQNNKVFASDKFIIIDN